jgi:hypothetical protein
MEIEINVKEEQANIGQKQLDRLRRTINVLCDDGFDVVLSFKNGTNHNALNENKSSYMGGRYKRFSIMTTNGTLLY